MDGEGDVRIGTIVAEGDGEIFVLGIGFWIVGRALMEEGDVGVFGTVWSVGDAVLSESVFVSADTAGHDTSVDIEVATALPCTDELDGVGADWADVWPGLGSDGGLQFVDIGFVAISQDIAAEAAHEGVRGAGCDGIGGCEGVALVGDDMVDVFVCICGDGDEVGDDGWIWTAVVFSGAGCEAENQGQ